MKKIWKTIQLIIAIGAAIYIIYHYGWWGVLGLLSLILLQVIRFYVYLGHCHLYKGALVHKDDLPQRLKDKIKERENNDKS